MIPMTSSDRFRAEIQAVTRKKAFGLAKPKDGRSMLIYYAILAWESSTRGRNHEKAQAAYLYQVVKNCKQWLEAKSAKTTGSAPARRMIIQRVRQEAEAELVNYPEIQRALGSYNRHKQAGARPATPLYGVYAHERAVYDQHKAPPLSVPSTKSFSTVGARFAPSATIMESSGQTVNPKKSFQQLTLAEYMKLDTLLKTEHNVLYMSQIQRLHYMVDVDQATFSRATDGTPYHMNGSTVGNDLGMGAESQPYMYACDRYGNIFIVREGEFDRDGKKVQLNHSTLCAGRDVVCAGTISIKNGNLMGITNTSGHYRPDTEALSRVLRKLRDDDGVNLNNVIVADQSQNRNTTTGAAFLVQNTGYKCQFREPVIQALAGAVN
jgi:hypothetical protein